MTGSQQKAANPMTADGYNAPEPITREKLFSSFNQLITSSEQHFGLLDGLTAQSVMRPVINAIREAQRQVDLATEKSALHEDSRRLAAMQEAIDERKQKIAALEKA